MSPPTISAYIVSVPSKVWMTSMSPMWRMTWFYKQDPVAAQQVARLRDHPARRARVVELRQSAIVSESRPDSSSRAICMQ